MRTRLRLTNELNPFLDQCLSRRVRRVCLSGDDELHWTLGIAQEAKQPLSIVQQQVRSFVGRETPRKTQCQRVGIK